MIASTANNGATQRILYFTNDKKMCASTRETEKRADTKLKKNIQTKAQQAEETTTMKKQTHH